MSIESKIKALLNWYGNPANESRVKLFLRRFVVRIFSPPDIYARYQTILAPLRKNLAPADRVLEIGSGAAGINRYLQRNICGVDISFDGPALGRMQRVKASAGQLPFRDRSFEWVVSADVLEHLYENLRNHSLVEMVRVARKGIFLIAPSGLESQEAEKRLASWLKSKRIEIPAWMLEHSAFKLPEEHEITRILKQAAVEIGRTVEIASFRTSNLFLWSLIWRVFTMTNSSLFYRVISLLLLPLGFWPISFTWKLGRGYRCYWQLIVKSESVTQLEKSRI